MCCLQLFSSTIWFPHLIQLVKKGLKTFKNEEAEDAQFTVPLITKLMSRPILVVPAPIEWPPCVSKCNWAPPDFVSKMAKNSAFS